MNEAQQTRAAALKLIIATQPAFLYWRHEPQAYLDGILGEARSYSVMPLKSWVDKGIVVTAGSDAPCTIPDPIRGIYYACNHPKADESLLPLDALRMHTAWPAYSSFDENRRGTLREGLLCDFVVLSDNPLAMPAPKLDTLRIEAVYFRGKRYESKKRSLAALLCKAAMG
jgi:predicted amidohydrolase YtcJ